MAACPVRVSNAGFFAALVAVAALLAFAVPAQAGVVTCPPGETYTMNAGDTSLQVQGSCTGDSALSYSLVSGPTYGSLVGGSDGAATYTPNLFFSGTDGFRYRATDADGGFAEGTVTIEVTGPASGGLPPSCPDPVRVFVPAGGSVLLTGNCSDPEGGPVTYGIVTWPWPDGLVAVSGTQVRYTPPAGVTEESFIYSATDPNGKRVDAEVQITVTPPGTTEVSTGTEATSAQPFVAAVDAPTGGPVSIGARTTSVAPPAGWFLLGTEFNIEAPLQSEADPLRLTFTVDRSQVPLSGEVVVFRDGTEIDQDCVPAGTATPDPCIESSGPVDPADPSGDQRITVLSVHASRWNLGFRKAPDTDGDGRIDSADGCPDEAGTAALNGCPPPATKDECKDSGWERYGARFKNQGACVSYVSSKRG